MARASTTASGKSPRAFRTISEAAGDLDLPQHVLRFWETKFSQIQPMKRAGGRRYYRPEDVDLLGGIKLLLYDRGYTIKGVQKLLKEKGVRHVSAVGRSVDEEPKPEPVPDIVVGGTATPSAVGGDVPEADLAVLNEVLKDLLECKRVLDQAV